MDLFDDAILLGFHVSRASRDRYEFDPALIAATGKSSIPTFYAARAFAMQMNQKRDLVKYPETAVSASEINAIALINGIIQYVFRAYCEQEDPRILAEALDWLRQEIGNNADPVLQKFVDEFPPQPVYLGLTDRDQYLGDTKAVPSNQERTLEENLLLWMGNINPAFSPYLELFDDDPLERQTAYKKVIENLHKFFDKVAQLNRGRQRVVPGGQNIVDFLLAPMRASPHSLEGQLAYILDHWSNIIGSYIYRLLRALDLIKEEHRFHFPGPGPIGIPTYSGEPDIERFTADKDWMPKLVLIAKNTYVWLDQLSRKYRHSITRLDQIPDEELDLLASWGFTGLWLIGLWERSAASQRVKQLCGNPEAVASAYSLFDYRVADALGGDEACNNLKERAWRRGIRLASDMVPNHVGIDGKWVIEHPDWFISLDYSPFPSYTFNGPDLSWDGRVGIYLEDHYYSRSDAAVVFKRVDRWTGSEKYIYHGNDGTSMPWNDTAQLNYLHPDVREAMVQLILHIARQFPIIRFDAAMTLVKKHFQRLWFPEPGTGGAIPSRAEHGMTRAQLDAIMPQEFWREVVDRAAVEAPDTLLLAEAFWLMESYFVRTLGMHRVYNSAFMNILRDEDNSKYRTIMKNTLEFDPEILRRWVNFMNNPDEKTAVEQFGKGDKYIGICTLMVTMPGLPMFGHGQVEGFGEKYGMEYRRAYWDEQPDLGLIQRHEREVFPLNKRRYLFAGVENFLMYDFWTPEGHLNENVFAYSNRAGDERALVVYHNVYADTRGWIKMSVSYSARTGNGDERRMVQKSVAEGLGLPYDDNMYCIFRDHPAGLEYIRNCKEIHDQGLYFELHAYHAHVFVDFRTVADNAARQYANLAGYLNGSGVPNMDEALQEILVQPIRDPFKLMVNADMIEQLWEARLVKAGQKLDTALLDEIDEKMTTLLDSIIQFNKYTKANPTEKVTGKVRERFEASLGLLQNKEVAAIKGIEDNKFFWGTLFGWLFVHALGEITPEAYSAARSRSWIDEWLVARVIANALKPLELSDYEANQAATAVKFMTMHQKLFEGQNNERAEGILNTLLQDSDAQQFLRLNRYQNVLWFDKDAFEQLLLLLRLIPLVTGGTATTIETRSALVEKLSKAQVASGYQVEKLRAAVKEPTKAKATASTAKKK